MRRVKLREVLAQHCQDVACEWLRIVSKAVIRPGPAAAVNNQPGVFQVRQMARNGGLGHAECVGQVANA